MNNNYSAGVLIYTKHNKNIYFLLGRSPDNKWSDFGGHSELKDHNDPEQTASRECYEETLGSIYDIDFIKKKIKNKKCCKIHSKTYTGNPYYMYLLYVNYSDEYRTRFNCTKLYIKNVLNNKYIEKNDIRWISYDTIIHSFENKSFISLRNVFLTTFKLNKSLILNIIN